MTAIPGGQREEHGRGSRLPARLELSKRAAADDVQGVIELLNDERTQRSPRLQRSVISEMALSRNPSYVPTLMSVLGNPRCDDTVRVVAGSALRDIRDVESVNALIAAIDDPSWKVRSIAAEALGQIGDVAAVEPLLRLVDDPQRLVVHRTLQALGKIGSRDALSALVRALERGTPRMRWEAATALESIGDPVALPALRDAAARTRFPYRKRIKLAIAALERA